MLSLDLNRQHKMLLGGIIGITLVVYFQSLSFDFVNWDDDYYVINNLQVTNPTAENLGKFFTEGNTANYHPLTMLSLTLNYVLGGENAFGYHLFNLIFHLFNTFLLYLWTKRVWPDKQYLPLFVAGVFALHPMHVESVAWVSSRKDVLFFCFYFLGLLSYHRYYSEKLSKHLWVTLLFFVLSALSKPTSVVFPVHLLLIDYLVDRKISISLLTEKIPFFIVSILIGLATVFVQTDAGAISIESYSIWERLQLASYSLNLYLAKFFIPQHLSSFHPYPLRPFEIWVSIAPFISAGVVGACLWFWRMKRTLVFSILFFLSSIALLIQLVSVGSTIIAERYSYLPYVGMSIAVYFLLEELIFKSAKSKKTLGIVLGSFVFLMAILTFVRAKVWENGETLWTDAIEKYPRVAGSWGGRGVYYRLEKNYNKALRDLNQAVQLNPNEAMFYSNRGNIYFDLQQDDAALFDYNNCIRLDSTDENAFANRGAIYGRKGRYNEAIADLTYAISLNPEFFSAYMNRGIVYSQYNQRGLAKQDFKQFLTLQPEDDGVWNALAIEHQHLGEFDSSLVALNNAIQLNAEEGVYFLNRGISLRLMKDQTNANANFNTARSLGIDVNPGYYQPVE